jgi:hypothetical protein
VKKQNLPKIGLFIIKAQDNRPEIVKSEKYHFKGKRGANT